jgi:hypothetical protein
MTADSSAKVESGNERLRKFGAFSAFALTSIGLALSAVILWPKPKAIVLAGLSLSATFGGLVALCRAGAQAYASQVRRCILLVSAMDGLGFAALAWKYRATSPAISLASLITIGVLSLAVLATFWMTQSN